TGIGFLAFRSTRRKATAVAHEAAAAAPQPAAAAGPAEEAPIAETLRIDELKPELGYGPLSLVREDDTGTDRRTEQIKALRRQLATELGFVMPPVRILDNMQLEPNEYCVKIQEVEAGKGQIFANQLMVMDPMGKEITLPGVHTTEPTFGLPATWIEPALRGEAELRRDSIMHPSTLSATHGTEPP